jgi:hypothetical protein
MEPNALRWIEKLDAGLGQEQEHDDKKQKTQTGPRQGRERNAPSLEPPCALSPIRKVR